MNKLDQESPDCSIPCHLTRQMFVALDVRGAVGVSLGSVVVSVLCLRCSSERIVTVHLGMQDRPVQPPRDSAAASLLYHNYVVHAAQRQQKGASK